MFWIRHNMIPDFVHREEMEKGSSDFKTASDSSGVKSMESGCITL